MMQFPYFSRDKWGQSSGIIVMRPTGCPEEEVRAELYASIQGQRGARQGGLHHCVSSLSVSSRVSLERGVVPTLPQDAMNIVCLVLGWEFTITQPSLTWIEFALMKRKWKHKS